jgi:hypothetical protein
MRQNGPTECIGVLQISVDKMHKLNKMTMREHLKNPLNLRKLSVTCRKKVMLGTRYLLRTEKDVADGVEGVL